jgi:hypothetical protein
VAWDVTDQVQKMVNGIPQHTWPNLGWVIFDGTEDSSDGYNASFCSRESGTEASRPVLVVRFLPPKINLTLVTPTIMAGTWAHMTLKRISQKGVLVAVGDRLVTQDWISIGNLNVDLSSSSSSGRFSLTEGGQPVDRVTIPDGLTQLSLYYYDENAGSQVIRASTSDFEQGYYLGASESIEVIVDVAPPTIAGITMTPGSPVGGEIVEVSASVTDVGSGVREVTLRFSVGDDGAWISVNMIQQGGLYVAQIPAQDMLSKVRYVIRCSDMAGNVAETEVQEFSVGIPLWIYAAVLGLGIALAFLGFKVLKKGKS